MKTSSLDKYKIITPREAIGEFIRSYSSSMNSSLQIIVNVINQAKNQETTASITNCVQQANETISNMKTGLELMRKNILSRMSKR